MRKILLFLILILLLTGCSKNETENELIIFAASSLIDPLNEIVESFNNKYDDIDVKVNYSSSGTLQKQIQKGAPADIFFSASVKNIEELVDSNFIINKNVFRIIKNELVLVCNDSLKEKVNSIYDLENDYIKNISITIPETSPLGFYSKESLINLKLWDKLKNKIVYAKNARTILNYLQSKNVDVAIIYKSDINKVKNIRIIKEIENNIHSEIIYPVAIVNDTLESKLFIDYLKSEKAKEIFAENGFIVNK